MTMRFGATLLMSTLLVCSAVLVTESQSVAKEDATPKASWPARIQVLGKTGRPFQGARVSWVTEHVHHLPLFDPRRDVRAHSNKDGMIEDYLAAKKPSGQIPGDYVVWAPGHASVRVPSDTTMTTVTLRLLEGKRLHGTVKLLGATKKARPVVYALPSDKGDLASVATSSDDGSYAFDHLAPGIYSLLLRTPTGRLQYLGRAESGGEAKGITLRQGIELRGRVMDADAHGEVYAVGARVRLTPLPRGEGGAVAKRLTRTPTEDESALEDEAPLETVVDDKGRFLFTGLQPGVYRVEMADPLWTLADPHTLVQVDDIRVNERELWFARRRTTVRGRVIWSDEKPVAGVTVSLVRPPNSSNARSRIAVPQPVMSDENGQFEINGVTPASDYRILLVSDAIMPVLDKLLDVTPGGANDVGDIAVKPAWSLRVKTRDIHGKPVPDAKVTAHPMAKEAFSIWDTEFMPRLTATTDAEGLAVIAHMPEDDVVWTISAPGYQLARGKEFFPSSGTVRDVEATLTRLHEISGAVRRLTGPVRNAYSVRARAHRSDFTKVIQSRQDGTFQMDGLPSDPLVFEVLGRGEQSSHVLAQRDQVMPGIESAIDLVIPPVVSISGRVEDSDRDERIHVSLYASVYNAKEDVYSFREVGTYPTEDEGSSISFTIEDVPPGRYELRAVQGLRDSDVQSVLVKTDNVDGVSLTLMPISRLAGSVFDADGKPVFGARIQAERLQGPGMARYGPGCKRVTTTRDNGAFAYDEIASGLWRLTVVTPDGGVHTQIVRLPPNEVLVLPPINMTNGGTIVVRAEASNGEPVDGAMIAVTRSDDVGPTWRMVTSEQGIAELDGLQPGSYRLFRRVRGIEVPADQTVLVDVANEKRSEVTFRDSSDTHLSGIIRRDGGEGAAGVSLELLLTDVGASAYFRRHALRSDEYGRFSVRGIPPGRYRLRQTDAAMQVEHVVQLNEGQDVEVELEVYDALLEGTVVDAFGDPVLEADVIATWMGNKASKSYDGPVFEARGRSDALGRFRIAGVPYGRYNVEVRAEGWPPLLADNMQSDKAGHTISMDLRFSHGGRIEVWAIDKSKQSVPDATVVIHDADGHPLHRSTLTTGMDGKLLLEGVAIGSACVRVHAQGYGRAMSSLIPVRSGRLSTVKLTLVPSGSAHVRIEDSAGHVLRGAEVSLFQRGESLPLVHLPEVSDASVGKRTRRLTEDGSLVIPDLRPGPYTVRVRVDGSPAHVVEQPLVIAEGRVARCTLRVDIR